MKLSRAEVALSAGTTPFRTPPPPKAGGFDRRVIAEALSSSDCLRFQSKIQKTEEWAGRKRAVCCVLSCFVSRAREKTPSL